MILIMRLIHQGTLSGQTMRSLSKLVQGQRAGMGNRIGWKAYWAHSFNIEQGFIGLQVGGSF